MRTLPLLTRRVPLPWITIGLLLVMPEGLSSLTQAGGEQGGCCGAGLSIRSLKHMDEGQLEQLFAGGHLATLPVGLGRGHVLLRTDARLPRTRARMAGTVWKGKYFFPDGAFTNQWVGFQAISSQVAVGPSLYDGQPCLILEYPSGTALFGNTRDELREIAPGLLLGRFLQRCPCPKLQGYFVLEVQDGCKKGCK